MQRLNGMALGIIGGFAAQSHQRRATVTARARLAAVTADDRAKPSKASPTNSRTRVTDRSMASSPCLRSPDAFSRRAPSKSTNPSYSGGSRVELTGVAQGIELA